MPKKHRKPVYKSRKAAEIHGAITYGSGKHTERKLGRGRFISYRKPRRKK